MCSCTEDDFQEIILKSTMESCVTLLNATMYTCMMIRSNSDILGNSCRVILMRLSSAAFGPLFQAISHICIKAVNDTTVCSWILVTREHITCRHTVFKYVKNVKYKHKSPTIHEWTHIHTRTHACMHACSPSQLHKPLMTRCSRRMYWGDQLHMWAEGQTSALDPRCSAIFLQYILYYSPQPISALPQLCFCKIVSSLLLAWISEWLMNSSWVRLLTTSWRYIPQL